MVDQLVHASPADAVFSGRGTPPWPRPTLRHLRRLTDAYGIIQHAKDWLPDYATGYCVDDNSRALLVTAQYYRLFGGPEAHELLLRYLNFLRSVQLLDGCVCNFVDYRRRRLEPVGSQDSMGRTLWALGQAATFSETYLRYPAVLMLHRLLPHIAYDFSPHALAYALLGLSAYGACSEFRVAAQHAARPLANALLRYYTRERADDWAWFKPELTYANARLPQALLCAGQLLQDNECLDIGRTTLDFLRQVTIQDGVLSVIGNKGWYPRGGTQAVYDQQPIDPGAMVEACLEAYRVTGDRVYFTDAVISQAWFYGRNVEGLPLYNPLSGGCCDGLCRRRVNTNQGAESVLAHLLAQLACYAVAPDYFSTAEDVTAH
ncbi:MAG TPA: hypothetical protein VGM23_11045 [Armatimonadota bacterium]